MSLLVTGSIGIDSVTTPHGSVGDVLGGAAVYFSFAAAIQTPVRLVGVVGDDFPDAFREILTGHDIDLAGLETRADSKTFRWTGKYVGDMNEAETVSVDLNVLGEDPPKVPAAFADSDVVFLANTHPALQRALLSGVSSPKLTVCDTMNLWIAEHRDELLKTLAVVDGVIINDAESRQLTGRENLIEAGIALLDFGPTFAVIKKGEHGALLITPQGATPIPAYPARKVVDPTGAGDSFAGGMLGFLASTGNVSPASLRRAVVRGTIASSFTIEAFSLDRIKNVTRDEFEHRVQEFLGMLRIE